MKRNFHPNKTDERECVTKREHPLHVPVLFSASNWILGPSTTKVLPGSAPILSLPETSYLPSAETLPFYRLLNPRDAIVETKTTHDSADPTQTEQVVPRHCVDAEYGYSSRIPFKVITPFIFVSSPGFLFGRREQDGNQGVNTYTGLLTADPGWCPEEPDSK